MKYFKNLRQLKYFIILCAVFSLVVLEILYVLFLGHTMLFVAIDLVVGTVMIFLFAEIAFYFGEQLQNQLQREIEDKKEIEEVLSLHSTALEAAANAVAITDINGRFIWVNSAFTKLTGYDFAEAVGQTHRILKSGKYDDAFYANLWQTVSSGRIWEGEVINRHKNGRLYTEEQIITPVINGDGTVTNYIAIKHDISERKKSEAKMEQYANRLHLIHTIDQAILSKQAPDEIARVVLDYVYQAVPCSRASVSVLDEHTSQGTVLAVIQEGETAVSPGYSFPMTEIEIRNLEAPETIIPVEIIEISNPQTNTGKQIQAEGVKAYIKIPLVAQGALIGFFNLGAKEKNTFTDDHIAIAQEIATSLAIALQQSRLYQRERNLREQAEALRETGEALNSTLDFDEILQLLLVQVTRAIRYDSAHIILIEGDDANICYTQGYERYGQEILKKVSSLSFKVSETRNLKWIIDHQEPLIIPDVYQYEGWRKDKGIAQTRAWVGVPIFVNGVISALFALSKQQPHYYHEGHVDTLRAFASQVGLALENARLYEELRAYTEELEDRVSSRTQALADANERLKELDRLKTKFISDVSHELRTPITNVTMYLDLLERGYEEKRQHYMNVLKQETKRLSQLIEDIFDESQYTSHLRQAEYIPVDLNEISYRTIKIYQAEAAQAGLILTYDLEAKLPAIWGEPLQLAQVISNLLRNAISYTVAGEICITTQQEGNFAVISVADTGVGIAPEDLPHLFDRFYRGHNVSQSTIPGTGLGLGVVREIIELHGGIVKASNNENNGATFKLMLPVSRRAEASIFFEESYDPAIEAVSPL
ncbi:MAG: GAF domain-containing protein [Anaerolineae bacterium]|nr:GAF domain-containing protein [Anaerolineae bacterium]